MKKLLRTSVNAVPSRARSWIKHIPGVAGFQRYLVNRFLSGAPFVHTLNSGPAAGLTFEVLLPLDKAIWAGTYETEFATAICREVRRGDVCYDVGGYRGYLSGAMALAGASRVLVFEPLPANQQALRRLCELNPGLNIALNPVAIGNADGTVRLLVMADASMGKLATSAFQRDSAASGAIDVPLRRLDSMVQAQEIPVPQLIKIDVEGAELDVLHGAASLLRADRPRIFVEAHSAALEAGCSTLLAQHGYAVRRVESHRLADGQTRHLIALPR